MTRPAKPVQKAIKNISLSAPPLYFMHIPKTAGSSLSWFLRSLYFRRRILILREFRHLPQNSLSGLQSYTCYSCHFGPGFFKLVSRPGLPVITMLRQPIEQTVSKFYYFQQIHRQEPERLAPDYRRIWAGYWHAGLADLLADEKLLAEYSDGQCRELGNELDLRAYLADGEIGARGETLLKPLPSSLTEQNKSIGEIAARAHRQLEKMAIICLTERFQESLTLIADFLGVKPPVSSPGRKIGPRKKKVEPVSYQKSIPAQLVEQVEAMTRYDQELYAHATELFNRQWSAYLARPARTHFCLVPELLKHTREPVLRQWRRARERWPRLQSNPAVKLMRRLFR